MGITPRQLLRRKGTPYDALGLDDPKFTDDRLIDLMIEQPILINRPIVVSPLGVKLCRPSEAVLDLLPNPQDKPFIKEDGTPVASPKRLPTTDTHKWSSCRATGRPGEQSAPVRRYRSVPEAGSPRRSPRDDRSDGAA